MSAGISKYGWTGIDWSFGDGSELRDSFYVADASECENVLKRIFGDTPSSGDVYIPLKHPRFPKFGAVNCQVTPIHEKSVQGNDDGQGDWQTSIGQQPKIVGGLKFTITFAPLTQSGNYTNVTEQTADFSAQVMSIISNAQAQKDDTCLKWSDGKVCTNLRGIIKVVPKLEFMQKRIFCTSMPNDTKLGLIGAVNSCPFKMLDETSTTQKEWPAGTVLLSSMPVLRRMRYDGSLMWDTAYKFSAITLKDKIENDNIDYVTWQRLFHVDDSRWDTVTWPDGSKLYPEKDLNQLFNPNV